MISSQSPYPTVTRTEISTLNSVIPHVTASGESAGVWIRRRAWGCRARWSCEEIWTAISWWLLPWEIEEWSGSGGGRTSWILLVLISRTTQGKDFALKPRFTWGQWYLSLRNKKGNHWIEFLCYFVSVCDSMWSLSLLSTCCVLFLLCELKTDLSL